MMGGIDWALQLQNDSKNIDLAVGTGREFWAIQSTEAFFQTFVDEKGLYPDGVAKCYTTIQAAIDACVNNRGDVVNVVGEWTSDVNLVNLNKWGITVRGATDWNNITGGGNANITCTGAALATVIISHAKCHLENLVIYANGTGETKGIEFGGSVSQILIRNVEIVKNGGTNGQGYGILGTNVPVRACFEHIKITGKADHSLKWGVGIQSASYGCVWRDIEISDTTAQAIYNVDSSGDLFEDITCMPSCVTGLQIGGGDAANSVIKHCHVLAATPGVSSALISQSYIAGLSAYAGT